MKMWISKYWLSGIREAEGSITSDDGVAYFRRTGDAWSSFRVGKDAHADRQDALAAADMAKAAKIASLRKQIAKLERLDIA